MAMSDWGLLASVLVAVFGSVGGFAALMKVNADNSKTVSEGATNVVKLLRDQVNDLASRVEVIEQYAEDMEAWSGKVTDLLAKAIAQIPEEKKPPFRAEREVLERARPRRHAVQKEAS